MKVKAHNGGGVASVADATIDACSSACAVVAVARVDGALFGADKKGVGVRGWE